MFKIQSTSYLLVFLSHVTGSYFCEVVCDSVCRPESHNGFMGSNCVFSISRNSTGWYQRKPYGSILYRSAAHWNTCTQDVLCTEVGTEVSRLWHQTYNVRFVLSLSLSPSLPPSFSLSLWHIHLSVLLQVVMVLIPYGQGLDVRSPVKSTKSCLFIPSVFLSVSVSLYLALSLYLCLCLPLSICLSVSLSFLIYLLCMCIIDAL